MSNVDRQLLIRAGGGADTAPRLSDWLREDASLRERAQLQHNMVLEGDMGAPSEIMTIALASETAGIIAAAPAGSLTTRRSDITLTGTRPNGDTIGFDATGMSYQLRVLAGPPDTPQ
ncbi:effector-associated constant component EACC1 [Nocardia bovistercoris]|uniref:Uncharacterized protein n=1 Tax=Nocardia bovistercoris TaxID=2785916 RepID=A0A931I9A8_9NOCA|nr:hypothetical protein [Nocardia bovistercoris]MBH0776696.1 hypothetical protein [Nocardia bovistercoris]